MGPCCAGAAGGLPWEPSGDGASSRVGGLGLQLHPRQQGAGALSLHSLHHCLVPPFGCREQEGEQPGVLPGLRGRKR